MVSYTAETSRLSIKGQVVNILGFAGHAVFFYLFTQFCSLCNAKAAIDSMWVNEWAWLCSDKTLLKKKSAGWIWPMGHSLLTPEFYFSTCVPKWSLECIYCPASIWEWLLWFWRGFIFSFPQERDLQRIGDERFHSSLLTGKITWSL